MCRHLQISVVAGFVLLLVLHQQAHSQRDARRGYRFRWDADSRVVAVDYFGKEGLRSTRAHEHPDLVSVEIVYGTELTADDLNYLGTLKRVRHLKIGEDLVDSPVTIEGDMIRLSTMSSLESLHLCKDNLHDDDLRFIGELPQLTDLAFNAEYEFDGVASALSDRSGVHLSRAKELKSIYVMGHGELTDDFISNLTEGVTGLRELVFRCPALTNESLRLLATRCEDLTRIDLASDNFSDEGVKYLAQLRNLERLSLESNSLSTASIDSVGGFLELRTLDLTIPSITDEAVLILAGLPKLERLVLRQPTLTDAQFAMFRDHKLLKTAFINGEKLTNDQVLKVIETIPTLEYLDVGSKNAELQDLVWRTLKSRKNDRR